MDIERYNRHILLSEIGKEGQKKIIDGKILVIGAGGLGSANSLYLAAAGVGNIGIMDADVVDISNLQRQVIHFTPDLDKPKVLSAKEKIEKINSNVRVTTYQTFATKNNIAKIIKGYDFVVDATDNFEAKCLINDTCVKLKKPFSHGGVLEFCGQTMTYIPGEACYRCIFENPPQTSAKTGILGAVAGMLGTIQAAEALKFLTNAGELLTNELLVFDALKMDFRKISISKNSKCPVCKSE